MCLPKLSVVIPAYNAEATLGSCINAVLRQDYEGVFEVIVVDDGSTDATSNIANAFDRVTYVSQKNAGPAAARNAGAEHAAGDIVCFTDSDCQPQSDWLSKLVLFFANDHADVVAGSYGIANPGSLLARCIHQEIRYRHKHLMGEWIEVFGSYNVAFRREIFEQLGGFAQAYTQASGEDNDLSYRLRGAGFRIRFAKDAKVDHSHPSRIKRYLYEQFRHGFWRANLYRGHPEKIKGDGYTFLKDAIEVPLSGVALLLGGASVFGLPWKFFAGYFIACVVFELVFAFVFGLKNPCEAIYYAGVMLLRAFARTFGFLAGLVCSSDKSG